MCIRDSESDVGLDMKEEGAGNLEARAAMEKGELYIAGPFELIQGEMCIRDSQSADPFADSRTAPAGPWSLSLKRQCLPPDLADTGGRHPDR